MGITVEIYPWCDFCFNSFNDSTFCTKKECRANMKINGWKTVNGKDWCGNCQLPTPTDRSVPND